MFDQTNAQLLKSVKFSNSGITDSLKLLKENDENAAVLTLLHAWTKSDSGTWEQPRASYNQHSTNV